MLHSPASPQSRVSKQIDALDERESPDIPPDLEKDMRNLLQLMSFIKNSSCHPCIHKEERSDMRLKEYDSKLNLRPDVGGSSSDDKEKTYYYKRFRSLHGRIDQRLIHIRNQLTSLGGGGRTAKALESVQKALHEIDWPGGSEFMSIQECVSALAALDLVMTEVKDSFKELGVYNVVLFNKLDTIKSHSQIIKERLDVEYGQVGIKQIPVDGYLDSLVWKDLLAIFEGFLHELSDIDDKGMPTIHRSQEFQSQRYLLLTTIATFLSSVTATTLQITATDSDDISILSQTMNSLWLISLVFSTASAVFSLLIMTWHQSHVRQPDKSLPPWAHSLLKNGPTLTLVASVASFSVGLCLLSFSISKNQKHSMPAAAVPTIFAGTFSTLIFVLTSRLLFEKWKDDIFTTWNSLLDTLDRFFLHILEIINTLILIIKRLLQRNTRIRRTSVELSTYLEHSVVQQNSLATLDKHAFLSVDCMSPISSTSSGPEAWMSDYILQEEEKLEASNFENTLQFSPLGTFLASYSSGIVTIYAAKMLTRSFFLKKTLEVPENDTVKQILWKPSGEYLLIRTKKLIQIWGIKLLHSSYEPFIEGTLVTTTSVASQSAHWLYDLPGFTCAIKNIVVTFNIEGEILKTHEFGNRYIRDVAYFGNQSILCLASPIISDSDSGAGLDKAAQILIFSTESKSIQRQIDVFSDQTSLSVSYSTNKVILHGSKRAVQVFEMTSGGLLTLDEDTYSLSNGNPIGEGNNITPWDGLSFFGKDSRLVMGVSGFEVTLFEQSHFRYKILHIFSTPNDDAKLKAPISFAASPSVPYMFAFGLEDGSIKVWSIQSDKSLIGSDPRVVNFVVHDRRSRFGEPSVSMGRYLTLPPPATARMQSV